MTIFHAISLSPDRPLFQTQLSKWRALVNGSPALPSAAFSYISRAFRQTTPYIVGALRLLAESYLPQELNKVGFSLYADFRPTVDGWGKRGEVRCERILSLRKEEREKHRRGTLRILGVTSKEHPQNNRKNRCRKKSSLGEYETALDENLDPEEKKLNNSYMYSRYSLGILDTGTECNNTCILRPCNKSKYHPMYSIT